MKFIEYYRIAKNEIEDKLREIISKEPEIVHEIFFYAIEGGKRFRPTLTLLSCDALEGNHKQALVNACIIELVHQASLIHDDIIDGDLFRRGKETVWKKFGAKIAVLSGDALLSKALSLIEDKETLKCISNCIKNLLLGVLKEKDKESLGREEYYEIVMLKTASLFETATYIGALCSEAPRKQKIAMKSYGKFLGIMYQIVDDVVDGDAPLWLEKNFEEGLEEHYEDATRELDKIPESEFKEALEDAIGFMLLKLAKEGGEKVVKRVESALEKIRKR